MTIDSAKPSRLVCDAICQVASGISPAEVADLHADDLLQDVLNLDQLDLLQIANEIFERCGVDIPEPDFVHMETLGAFENYLTDRLATVEG